MKQHTTPEQLKELNDIEFKSLLDWYRQRLSRNSSQQGADGEDLSHKNAKYILTVVGLSIGDMFEYIEEKCGKGLGVYGVPAGESKSHPLGGYAIKAVPMEDHIGIFGTRDGYLCDGEEEFCDALWESVKQLIKNEILDSN